MRRRPANWSSLAKWRGIDGAFVSRDRKYSEVATLRVEQLTVAAD